MRCLIELFLLFSFVVAAAIVVAAALIVVVIHQHKHHALINPHPVGFKGTVAPGRPSRPRNWLQIRSLRPLPLLTSVPKSQPKKLP